MADNGLNPFPDYWEVVESLLWQMWEQYEEEENESV